MKSVIQNCERKKESKVDFVQHDYVLRELNCSFTSSATNCDSGLNTTLSNQNSAEEAVMHKDLL